MTNDRLWLVQIFKFGLVGFFNTGIHYLVFYFLYAGLGFYYLGASTLGYGAGLINSYLWNRSWTFKSMRANRKVEFAKFSTVNLISLGINLAALKLFVVQVELQPELAQVFAIFFSLSVNFAGNKFWTFSPEEGR